MAVTSFKLPTSVIQNGTGVNAWTDPNNILLVDGEFASTSDTTAELVVGTFNLDVPADASISNFTVKVKGYRGSFNTTLQIYAVDATTGISYSFPMDPFQGFDGTNTLYTLPSTLFGTVWTSDQVNNIQLKLMVDGELHVDSVEINCTYVPFVEPVPVEPSDGEVVVDEFVQGQRFQLAQSMTADDLYLFAESFNLPDGTEIQYADFHGEEAFITVDQGVPGLEENIRITNVEHDYNGSGLVRISIGDITNRGLGFIYPYTGSVNRAYPHNGTAEFVISNSAPFYDRFLRKNQINALVSAPIYFEDEDAVLPDPVHNATFRGAGVTVINDPSDSFRKIVTIAGTGVNPPQVVETSSTTSGGSQVSSITWEHVSSGINRLLVVQVSTEAARTITGITFNGIALTQRTTTTVGTIRQEQWTLTAPTVGTYDIVVTLSGAAYITAGAETYVSVNQATPIGDTSTATGSSTAPSVVVNTTVDNSIVVDGLATGVLPIVYTIGAGQTENWKITTNPSVRQGASSVESAGTQPDAITMSWTLNQSTSWAITALELIGISSGSGAGVQSVTGLNTDNTDPANPVVEISVDGTTIQGSGTPGDPLVAVGGGSGGGTTFIDQTPDNGTYGLLAGAVNGSNTLFTVSQGEYLTGKLQVFLNGLIQLQGASDDWQQTTPASGTFTFNTAPITGDIITVVYETSATSIDNYTVKATSADVSPDYLDDKIEITSDNGSATIVKTIENPGGNEKVIYDISVPSGNGSLLSATQFLPVSSQVDGSVAGEPMGNVLTDSGTSRIYVEINDNVSNTSLLRIFKNDYGSFYKEGEITVNLSDLSSTNGTNLDQISWTKSSSFLYALVRYRRTSSGSYTKIDVLRYNLDGTGLVATNIYTGASSGGDQIIWGSSPDGDKGATVVGSSLFTTWYSASTNEFREYTISGTSYTLANTYTVSASVGGTYALSYDSVADKFYLYGGSGASDQLIQKYEIIGSVLTADGSSFDYPELTYMNTEEDGDGLWFSRIENITADSYTIYTINSMANNDNNGGGGFDRRSYWLVAVTFPKQ